MQSPAPNITEPSKSPTANATQPHAPQTHSSRPENAVPHRTNTHTYPRATGGASSDMHCRPHNTTILHQCCSEKLPSSCQALEAALQPLCSTGVLAGNCHRPGTDPRLHAASGSVNAPYLTSPKWPSDIDPTTSTKGSDTPTYYHTYHTRIHPSSPTRPIRSPASML